MRVGMRTIRAHTLLSSRRYTKLNYTTLHYTTLHYTTLHYTTLQGVQEEAEE